MMLHGPCSTFLLLLFSLADARAQQLPYMYQQEAAGTCNFEPVTGAPVHGACSPEQFTAAILSKTPGSYEFILPKGGCSLPRQIDIGDGQVVTIRAPADGAEKEAVPVFGRFTVGGSGQLTLTRVHLEAHKLALLIAGEAAIVRADGCEFANNRHEWAGAVALLAGEFHVAGSRFTNNECINAAYGG